MKSKVTVLFLIIFVVLLMTITAYSLFHLQQQKQRLNETQVSLATSVSKAAKIEEKFQTAKKQMFLLEEKNKGADKRINDLLDELDLGEGIREEIKQENFSLQEQVEKLTQDKKELVEKLANVKKESEEAKELKKQAQAALEEKKKLEEKIKQLQAEKEQILSGGAQASGANLDAKSAEEIVLKPVVVEPEKEATLQEKLDAAQVLPSQVPEGRILSVDTETEFVIVNLGQKDGIKRGDVLSVYRGDNYLGDIKVTRLQPEMAAADLLPPFTSQVVRKNDQVVVKK